MEWREMDGVSIAWVDETGTVFLARAAVSDWIRRL